MTLQIAILGSLEPRMSGEVIPIPAGRQRALLTLLAVRAPQPVAAEFASEALWPRSAPTEATRSLQVTVSRLRRSLGPAGAALETVAAGYRLAVEPDAIDARRFETLLGEARRSRAAGNGEAARQALDDALALWRGPALADAAYEPFAQTEIARLEELRVTAWEERIDVRMVAGEHALVVAELEQLSTEHPTHERLVGLRMLALYRSGRQTEALDVYRQARQRLVDELGVEPGPALQELHQAILEHKVEPAPRGAPTIRQRRRGLPAPPNRTIGRAQELAALGDLLRTRSVRLLTLTGPGGVGKTRLALEFAHTVETSFREGAAFVALGALQRPEDVPAAFAEALRVTLLSGESAEQAVERFLDGKHTLLVVDNCEHVLEAAPFIAGLVGACPGVTILATSREPLAVHAEQCFPLGPLALPAGASEQARALAEVDAVALFCERAHAHDPAFRLDDDNAQAVARVCRRLDGLPLAIELAAARCALLSPGEIEVRLQAALGALGSGPRDAPARQRTLHATVDWSHELLSGHEQRCFARLAVFRGGASLAAAEAITGADLDTLDRLVAKHLLVRRRTPTRLHMLETIRAYAAERLAAAADEQSVRARHFGYYLALAREHGSAPALCGTRRAEHLARLDEEVDNLHAALAWAVGADDPNPALELCAALDWYWFMRDRYADAAYWSEQALSNAGIDADPALRVRALWTRSLILFPLGRGAERSAVLAEAETLARRLGEPALLSQVLQSRVSDMVAEGRPDLAEAFADEAQHWAEAAADPWACAMVAFARVMIPNAPALRERVDRATTLLTDVGDAYHLANMLSTAAYMALIDGSDHDARDFVLRALPLARELDSPGATMLLSGNTALVALFAGETEAAGRAFGDELRVCREIVARPFVSEGLLGLAAVAAVHGDDDQAARLCGASAAHRYGQPDTPVDARVQKTFIGPARARHGDDAWQQAFAAGATLGFEDAIAAAID